MQGGVGVRHLVEEVVGAVVFLDLMVHLRLLLAVWDHIRWVDLGHDLEPRRFQVAAPTVQKR